MKYLSWHYMLHSLPEIKVDDINFLWGENFYDQYLSGICSYQEKYYLFQNISDDDTFVLFLLNDKTFKEKEKRQRLFEKYVGNHNNFKIAESDKFYQPQELHHIYYELFKDKDLLDVHIMQAAPLFKYKY